MEKNINISVQWTLPCAFATEFVAWMVEETDVERCGRFHPYRKPVLGGK